MPIGDPRLTQAHLRLVGYVNIASKLQTVPGEDSLALVGTYQDIIRASVDVLGIAMEEYVQNIKK